MEIPVKSKWGAVVVLVLAACAVGYGFVGRSLDAEAEKVILAHIRHGDYLRHALKSFQDAGGLEAEGGAQKAAELLETAKADVEIASLEAKGSRKKPVVRVEYLVDGRPPEGVDPVVYLRMERSALTGWRVKRESTALDYHLAFVFR